LAGRPRHKVGQGLGSFLRHPLLPSIIARLLIERTGSGTCPAHPPLFTDFCLTEGRYTGDGVPEDQGVHLARVLVGQNALQVIGVGKTSSRV
jgi:hypothetical protein